MGKPGCRNRQSPCTEYIGVRRETQGTETSKYLKEKKTKVISQVVASEREAGQTRDYGFWGCGRIISDGGILVE